MAGSIEQHHQTPREELMSFRPLARADFPLILRWLNTPAVQEWWDDRPTSVDELESALERESGLLGLSGRSDDVREVAAAAEAGDGAAALALDVYVRRIAQAVAAMAVSLGGVDALVFTGGVGEHSARVRGRVTEEAACIGVERVEVVESREELVLARAARGVVNDTNERSLR